jgi:4-hydroxybenzoate polyprenyltransferase
MTGQGITTMFKVRSGRKSSFPDWGLPPVRSRVSHLRFCSYQWPHSSPWGALPCSPVLGRSTPIAASLNHLIGGALHFLLGYTAFHAPDLNGLLLGTFFGLVFAAGHLNQEVRDHEGDLLGGVRTSAVVFGSQSAFIASLCLFSLSYALIVSLAAAGILPGFFLWGALLWSLHVVWSLQALRSGLGFETALWMQRRYRLLFAIIGIAMLAS